MPGVIAAYTGDELAKFCGSLAGGSAEGGSGEEANFIEREEEAEESPPIWPLARGTVRWVGEAVVAVVAESRYQAEDAIEAVEVEYDVLPTVTDPEAAMEDGAPQIYSSVKNNIGARWDRDHGDIDAAFRDAPIVAKARIRSQRLSAVPMETRAVAAAPDPLINGLTVWTSTQAPHWNRTSIADALGLPTTRVRAIAPEVGGGFGVKMAPTRKTSSLPRWRTNCSVLCGGSKHGVRTSCPPTMAATSGLTSRSRRTPTAAFVGSRCTWCRIWAGSRAAPTSPN